MLVLSITSGSSKDFPLQVNNPDGTPNTSFLNTDSFETRVWRGEDTAAILSFTTAGGGAPTTTWINAATGQFQISFNDVDTVGYEVGQYRILTRAIRSGTPVRSAVVLDGFLSIMAAPGTTALRRTYGPFSDMVKYAKWITNLQDPNDIEGFVEQRADARDWLNSVILLNYRGTVGSFESHSTAAFMWAGGSGIRRSVVTSRWLRDALEAVGQFAGLTNYGPTMTGLYGGISSPPNPPMNVGALILRPEIRRVVAYKAISEVCLGYIGRGGDYASYGAMYRNAAEADLISARCELDINNDGLAEMAIPISTVQTLYT